MSSTDRIKPRTLKGFRDYLPSVMAQREALIDAAKAVYRSYGFSPIDTPALEYSEILLGKGGTESDKQLYRFEDQGGRDIALRFDLTVPLARFIAQHVGELGTPFKRYHVGPVWRGENTQRGRYREFLQCDFDTIGTESVLADIETVLVINDLFEALGFERFTIRVNNRKVLNGLLERIGLGDRSADVLRSLDKLQKIGPDAVIEELTSLVGTTPQRAAAILEVVSVSGDNRNILAQLGNLVAGSETGLHGVADLTAIVDGVEAAGLAEGRVAIDVSIARGLDYYTGTVFETFLDDLPGIGSCCSGGRYDDLAGVYTSQRLPGIGASLGVDRLLAAMEELGVLDGVGSAAPVMVAYFDEERGLDYLRLASSLRHAGIAVELYPEARKLGTQLKYADRRGHLFVVIVGPEEREAGMARIKDLTTGQTHDVPEGDLASFLAAALATSGSQAGGPG